MNGLSWTVIVIPLLIVILAFTFEPYLRAVLSDQPEERESSVYALRHGDEFDDHAAKIEARLREEYDRRFQAQLAEEREQMRATEVEQRNTQLPARTFDVPEPILSDISKLSNGIPLRTEILRGEGETAFEEIQRPDSYTATFQVKLRVPRPAVSIAEIEKGTPSISDMLPGFSALFPQGFVSPWYETLYRNKVSEIRTHSKHLKRIPSKNDAYDCNTILHLRSGKGRKVFFMQADMDAVLKGSDGDRVAEMPPSQVKSIDYDPFTAYQWQKSGDQANPMIAGWERRIAIGTKELENPALTSEGKKWVEERIAMLNSGIAAMRQRSYLISSHDPYIALPLFLLRDPNDAYAPKIGDFGVVIYNQKVYPCIVGDRGSESTAGEASARLAREVNPRWRVGTKVVPIAGVSYIIFPNSGEAEPSPPDYLKWTQKCEELLNEIGGLGEGFELHRWTEPSSKAADSE